MLDGNVGMKISSGARYRRPHRGLIGKKEELSAMDLWGLKPGDQVHTIDGARVEVLKETEDGRWVLVRYLESPKDPGIVGTEDLCHEDELLEPTSKNAATG